MDDRITHIAVPANKVDAFSDALADVLCWFQGFTAAIEASGERSANVPISLDLLRALKRSIDKAAVRMPAEAA